MMIRKKFVVEMAHQLTEAHSVCCKDTIHGHSYTIELFFEGNADKTGMIVDFGLIKDVLGEYIQSWDHCLVMQNTQPVPYLNTLGLYNKNLRIVDYNPTAELMAADMLRTCSALMEEDSRVPDSAILGSVCVHETATGFAMADMFDAEAGGEM